MEHKYRMILIVLMVLVVSVLHMPSAIAQGSSLTIIESNAEPDFPNSIIFSLVAESDSTISEVQLVYGASRADSMTVVDASFFPAQQVEASHVLDTQVFHVPPGVDLSYRWIIRDEEGNTTETDTQTIFYEDNRFKWNQLSEQNVTVYWYKGDINFGESLLQTSTRALNNLQQDVGASLVDPVSIYIYADTYDMRAALQSNEVEWVGGQARPDIGLIIAAIAPGDTAETRRIIPHELSHQVLHQATDNPYGGVPIWFDEGLAMHNQETHLDYHDVMLEEAALSNDLIPLEALSGSFPTDSERASLSYAQSHSVINYILANYGSDAMATLVTSFHAATPLNEALEEAIGLNVDELDAAWRESLPSPERSALPTPTPQLRAPEDRFSEEPSFPSSNNNSPDMLGGFNPQPDQPDSDTQPSSVIPVLGLPLWTELLLAVGCCTVLITLLGGTLIVILRVVGADKQQS